MRPLPSIPRLKRDARLLSRAQNIPLHAALDRVAAGWGFASWSLLLARSVSPASRFYAAMCPGDLVLVAARPGHGKTLMSLKLVVEAMTSGRRGFFFTLEYTESDVLDRLRALGVDWRAFGDLFTLDTSDTISAGHVVDALESAPRGTLAVIDYLQLLDQRRGNPHLMTQVRILRAFARERGLILVFVSQIDRSYDPSRKSCPGLDDVRLPNALDLSLFDKACFLNDGEIRFGRAN